MADPRLKRPNQAMAARITIEAKKSGGMRHLEKRRGETGGRRQETETETERKGRSGFCALSTTLDWAGVWVFVNNNMHVVGKVAGGMTQSAVGTTKPQGG